MFFDETSTIELCEEDPSKIFNLIDEGHEELTTKLLTKKIVDINTTNEDGNNVVMYMLIKGWYDEVLNFMKSKTWNINHQNNDGDTFAHILVTKKYLDVMGIIKAMLKNKKFIPNIVNNKNETILNKSMNNVNISTTIKILEDERFDNIDLVSFKDLYEKYIKNKSFGVLTKINNLEVIVDTLQDKNLVPRVQKLMKKISNNYKEIKQKVSNNDIKQLDKMIYGMLEACV